MPGHRAAVRRRAAAPRPGHGPGGQDAADGLWTGAGYAGGIMSASVDGINIALSILNKGKYD